MSEHDINFDDYAQADIAKKVEAAGVKKANLSFWCLVLSSILAGGFIAIGGIFFTLATYDSTLPNGLTRVIGGLVFCVGLILVIVAGAELFTGNNLIVMGFISRVVTFKQLIRNWGIVYIGNFIGSLAVVYLFYYTNIWKMGDFAYGAKAAAIAASKVNLTLLKALQEEFFVMHCMSCCLMCFGARQIISKIAAIIFPITAFVALSFEHSIANMSFIPLGLTLKIILM